MRNIIKNGIEKILIVFILIVMVSNFIMPNYVCATKAGDKLVSGFFYLLSYVGDALIQLMQKTMIGDSDIINNGKYEIKYSPGVIFSDNVAGLKINFISANEDDTTKIYLGTDADNKRRIIGFIRKIGRKQCKKRA